MDKRLHLLESFIAQGSDGETYKVFGYEHLAPNASLQGARELWEPTGLVEYRLVDGHRVDAKPDGSMRVANTGVELARK